MPSERDGTLERVRVALPNPEVRYAELFAAGALSQRRLLSAGDLAKEARRRAIGLSEFRPAEALEALDRAGFFQPLGFARNGFAVESTFLRPDPTMFVFREDQPFRPWSSYGQPEEGFRHVRERFSAWQLLYLSEALSDDWCVPLEVLTGPAERFVVWRQSAQPWLDRAVQRRAELERRWQPVVKLLVALEVRYWRDVTRRVTDLFPSGGRDRVDPLDHLPAELAGRHLLRRFRLKLDDVERLHAFLSRRAMGIDPLPQWYLLARQAPRERYHLLRGDAARAADLYDACEMLRSAYFDLTEAWLPDCDELGGVDVKEQKERRFGHPAPYGGRADLKRMLQVEGLYPHALHVFVEGQTEEIVLSRLLTWLGYRVGAGAIQITNIHGIDQAQRYEVILASASRYSTRTVVVADREGQIDRVAARLVQSGYVDSEEDVLLWEQDGRPSSFEEANFSHAELLRMMRAGARRLGAELRLSTAQLRAAQRIALGEARTAGRKSKGLATLALELARRPEHGSVLLTKPQLAEAMADRLRRDIVAKGGMVEAGKTRPLLHYLRFWLVAEAQRARHGLPLPSPTNPEATSLPPPR